MCLLQNVRLYKQRCRLIRMYEQARVCACVKVEIMLKEK